MPEQKFTQEQLANEQWLPIVDWEGWYSISTLGRWRREIATTRVPAGYIARGNFDQAGYRIAVLSRFGKKTGYRVHRLVMEAFVGIRPAGYDINHRNGIKSDNRLENLEYVPHPINVRHGRDVLGHNHSKITADDLVTIFILRYAGWTWPLIGRRISVSGPYASFLFHHSHEHPHDSTVGRKASPTTSATIGTPHTRGG